MRLSAAFAVSALVALVWPAAAFADQRVLSAADPVEAPPVLSGPKQPDVTNIDAMYDDAGAMTVTVTFAESITAAKTSERLDFWTWIDANQRDKSGCDSTTGGSRITSLTPIGSTSGTASVSGFDGEAPATNTLSADGLQATWSFTHPAIAGRDYRCVSLRVYGFVRSTASNPSSRYSTSCDCWTVSTDYDTLETAYFTRPDGSTLADLSLSGPQSKSYLRTAILRQLRRAPVGVITACRPGAIAGTRNCTLRWTDSIGSYSGQARVELREIRAVRSWHFSLNVVQVRKGCKPVSHVSCRRRIAIPMRVGQSGLS